MVVVEVEDHGEGDEVEEEESRVCLHPHEGSMAYGEIHNGIDTMDAWAFDRRVGMTAANQLHILLEL